MLEPFIAFFLVRVSGNILNNQPGGNKFKKLLQYLQWGIITLFVVETSTGIQDYTRWVWHVFLLGLVILALAKNEFLALRTLMLSVLPFVIISFASDIFKSVNFAFYKKLDTYFDVGIFFSIVWMVAMLIYSSRQQKALRLANEKAAREEEQKRLVTIKKEELEKLVAERTSELQSQKDKIENTLQELKATQSQLIQSEKMASLGELTAGIAHEIQNPLNFVNNFSELNTELIAEMNEAIAKNDYDEVRALANDINENEKKIMFHGQRADAIVKGMLQHSRTSTGEKELTDINALADEYLRLAYHGLRAKDKSFNATMKTDFDNTIPKIELVAQDIGRVILNLITNAFYAVMQKKKELSADYLPTVSVSTKKIDQAIELRVEDNGNGIPEENLDKIFQPFFTTKPTGQGTGLGLSLSYDIIKSHGGEIKVETKVGSGTTFILILPF